MAQKAPKTGRIVWLVVGGLLALGPAWGLLGTVVSMILAFQRVGGGTPGEAEALAGDISLALWTTAVGWAVCPIGTAIVIVTAIRLVRSTKRSGGGATDRASVQ